MLNILTFLKMVDMLRLHPHIPWKLHNLIWSLIALAPGFERMSGLLDMTRVELRNVLLVRRRVVILVLKEIGVHRNIPLLIFP
jgi:uncharacterized protein Usg